MRARMSPDGTKVAFVSERDSEDDLDLWWMLQNLIDRGHRFQKIGRKGELRYGDAATITVDVAARRVEGGAEPRRSHAAVPYDRRSSTTAQ